MPNKIVNLTFFHLTLLSVLGTQGLNSVAAKPVEQTYSAIESELQIKIEDLSQQGKPNIARLLSEANKSIENGKLASNSFLAEAEPRTETKSSNKLLKTIGLTLFILFVVPFGIFYPLFLFYRKLLIDSNELEESFNRQSGRKPFEGAISPIELGFQGREDTNKATVSQLQIAFSPTASDLRHRLTQICAEREFKDMVELMRSTTSVLVDRDYWTHINRSSVTLPLEEIKVEFDLLAYREKHKFTNEKLNLIARNSEIDRLDKTNTNYSYVVVTLIFCTTHQEPLFEQIITKEQLVDELVKLGKMRKDYLIRFELVWNPQEEDKYISNDQLLTEYSEMIRLL